MNRRFDARELCAGGALVDFDPCVGTAPATSGSTVTGCVVGKTKAELQSGETRKHTHTHTRARSHAEWQSPGCMKSNCSHHSNVVIVNTRDVGHLATRRRAFAY